MKVVEIKKGFIEKNSRGGGFFKFSKLRYVVIELGLLIYYAKKRSSPSTQSYSSISQSDGEDEKGRMNLYGARIANNNIKTSSDSDNKNSSKSNNSDLTIHIISGMPDKEPDLVLKAGSYSEALEWKQAILNHIAYANENEKLLSAYSSSSVSTSPILSGCNSSTNSCNNSASSKEQMMMTMFTSPRGVDDIFDDVNPIYKDSSARIHIKSIPTPTTMNAADATISSDSLKNTLAHMPSSSSSSSSTIITPRKPPPPPPRPMIPKTIMTCQKCNCQFKFSDFMMIRPIRKKITNNNTNNNINNNNTLGNEQQVLPIQTEEYAPYCERHYIQKYVLPGLRRFQALIRGTLVRRKYVVKKKKQWLSLNQEMANKFQTFQKRRDQVQYDEISYNIYTSFPEFSRAQLDKYSALYYRYVNMMPLVSPIQTTSNDNDDDDDDSSNNRNLNSNNNNSNHSSICITNGKKLDKEQLRAMMNELNFPLTDKQLHLLMEEVDDDQDGYLTLKNFITLFRNRGKGELMSGLNSDLFSVNIVDVQEQGVAAARLLFDQKIQFQRMNRNAAEREVKELAKKRAEARLTATSTALNKMNIAVASLMIPQK